MHDDAINTSYLAGTDNTLGGWGRRYFFTFYSEFGWRGGAGEAEATVLGAVLVASLLANIAIGAAVLRYRELRTVSNCLLLNLVIADLLFAAGIPAVAITRVSQQWLLGDVTCRLLPYSQFVCGFVLLWTLALISVDRHRCIVVPPYRSGLTPRLAAVLSAATWLLGAAIFLPVSLWFRQQHTEVGPHICTLVFPRSSAVNVSLCFTLPTTILACLLPMLLLVLHYHRIFRKLLMTHSRWTVPCVTVGDHKPRRGSDLSFVAGIVVPWCRKSSGTCNGSLSHHEELRLTKHVRVVRILLLNVLLVLLMWLPITVIMFLIYVDGRRPTEDTAFFLQSCHFFWALVVALLNTVVNPLLYGILSENFRSCFVRWWRHQSTVTASTPTVPLRSWVVACTRTPSSAPAQDNKLSACSIASIPEAGPQHSL